MLKKITTNPCKECIVRSMCITWCELLTDYISSHLTNNHRICYVRGLKTLRRALLASATSTGVYVTTQPLEYNDDDLLGVRRLAKHAIKIQAGEIIDAQIQPM